MYDCLEPVIWAVGDEVSLWPWRWFSRRLIGNLWPRFVRLRSIAVLLWVMSEQHFIRDTACHAFGSAGLLLRFFPAAGGARAGRVFPCCARAASAVYFSRRNSLWWLCTRTMLAQDSMGLRGALCVSGKKTFFSPKATVHMEWEHHRHSFLTRYLLSPLLQATLTDQEMFSSAQAAKEAPDFIPHTHTHTEAMRWWYNKIRVRFIFLKAFIINSMGQRFPL